MKYLYEEYTDFSQFLDEIRDPGLAYSLAAQVLEPQAEDVFGLTYEPSSCYHDRMVARFFARKERNNK